MDDKIRSKNIIPGCDHLTRPEEIEYLKKYLKKGIEKRDSSLKLVDEANPIPEGILGNSGNINSLEDTIVGLKKNLNDPNKLETFQDKIPEYNKNKVENLENTKISLNKSETENISNLEDTKINILRKSRRF